MKVGVTASDCFYSEEILRQVVQIPLLVTR